MFYFVVGIFLILLLGAAVVRSAIFVIAAVVLGTGVLFYIFRENLAGAIAVFAVLLLSAYGMMRLAGYNDDGTKTDS